MHAGAPQSAVNLYQRGKRKAELMQEQYTAHSEGRLLTAGRASETDFMTRPETLLRLEQGKQRKEGARQKMRVSLRQCYLCRKPYIGRTAAEGLAFAFNLSSCWAKCRADLRVWRKPEPQHSWHDLVVMRHDKHELPLSVHAVTTAITVVYPLN